MEAMTIQKVRDLRCLMHQETRNLAAAMAIRPTNIASPMQAKIQPINAGGCWPALLEVSGAWDKTVPMITPMSTYIKPNNERQAAKPPETM
jgi:hypothetical protein